MLSAILLYLWAIFFGPAVIQDYEVTAVEDQDGVLQVTKIPSYPRPDHMRTYHRIGSRQVVFETGLMTREEERELGRFYRNRFERAWGGVYKDARVQQYVNYIARRVQQASDVLGTDEVEFQVLASREVNAFMMVGGYGYVTVGLLAELESAAQLACIIGHEIGHYVARHTAREAKNRLADEAMYFARRRSFELEADQLGLQYAWQAGFTPTESLTAFQVFGSPVRLEHPSDSHPIPLVRMFYLYQYIYELPGREPYFWGRDVHRAVKKLLVSPSYTRDDEALEGMSSLVIWEAPWEDQRS